MEIILTIQSDSYNTYVSSDMKLKINRDGHNNIVLEISECDRIISVDRKDLLKAITLLGD